MKWVLSAIRGDDGEPVTFTYTEEPYAIRGHLAMQNGGFSSITLEEVEEDQ